MEEKLIQNNKLERNFSTFKEYLTQLSDEIEEDFVNNKEFNRKIRKHKWHQLLKDIKSLNSKLNIIYGKITFLRDVESYQWKK